MLGAGFGEGSVQVGQGVSWMGILRKQLPRWTVPCLSWTEKCVSNIDLDNKNSIAVLINAPSNNNMQCHVHGSW